MQPYCRTARTCLILRRKYPAYELCSFIDIAIYFRVSAYINIPLKVHCDSHLFQIFRFRNSEPLLVFFTVNIPLISINFRF